MTLVTEEVIRPFDSGALDQQNMSKGTGYQPSETSLTPLP